MPSLDVNRWTVGAVEITRVGDPDFELLLPQDPDTTAALPSWLAPQFVTDDRALRVGSSAIAIRTPSALIVVDPFLAFDDVAKTAPRLSALRRAGIDPDEVDIVVNTHIDGIGANVLADGAPAFSNARYAVPAAELDGASDGQHGDVGMAWLALAAAGAVDELHGGETLAPGVRVEDAPGHNPGHVVVWVESGGSHAVVVGHLFLHPAQIASPQVTTGDRDPAALAASRRALLERCVETKALVVGPLFAPPGAGRVETDADTWRLVV